MTGKVAVLGDADFVMPFAALGLETFAVEQAEQMKESARKLIEEKYALVVVAENIAGTVQEVFDTCRDAPTPCVVVVPFTTESEGHATRMLGETLKMATGIDILQNN
jgi:vacuolar-type H+-ATPase subunit F/Vma7